MDLIDSTTPFGQRVGERLEQEQVIWLVTLGADGTPQPSPVWFLWDGATILIYSKPDAPKLRNIARHPQVALHFNSGPDGNDIAVITGSATLEPDAPLATALPAYMAKYAAGIRDLGMEAEPFANEYRAALRITPAKLRGFV